MTSQGGKSGSKKTAKRVVAKAKKSAAKKNMDTFFLRCKTLYNQIPSQGVTVANYVYGGTQLLGGNLLTNAEFNFYRLQYDQFRVNRVKVIVTPKANVFDAARAQADQNYTLTGDGMIHTCIDRDEGIIAPSVALISRQPSYKAYSLLKKFSRSYSVTYPRGVWLDAQNPSASNKQGLVESLGLTGGVTFYAENLVEDAGEIFNEPWAEVCFQFDVVFRGKTSGSMSFETDEGGKVTAVRLTNELTGEALKPLSTLHGLRGSIADSLIVQGTLDDADPLAGQSVPIDDNGNVVE